MLPVQQDLRPVCQHGFRKVEQRPCASASKIRRPGKEFYLKCERAFPTKTLMQKMSCCSASGLILWISSIVARDWMKWPISTVRIPIKRWSIWWWEIVPPLQPSITSKRKITLEKLFSYLMWVLVPMEHRCRRWKYLRTGVLIPGPMEHLPASMQNMSGKKSYWRWKKPCEGWHYYPHQTLRSRGVVRWGPGIMRT